jgi:D-beta-D-heptose 7-phosphate kinase/D-beta-D-heptose 1-phosphate adenosyltransferase
MVKIFVNGTFDVLHTGHLDLLNYAKSLGDNLLVAIDSDQRVKSKKGNDRPFNNELTRKTILENIKAVDSVTVFNTDLELENTIEQYQPDFMIVGSDWKDKEVIGSKYAKRVLFYERTNGESTTKTIEHFIARRSVC